MTPHHPRFHTGAPDEHGARTTRCETCPAGESEPLVTSQTRIRDLWIAAHRKAAQAAADAERARAARRTA